MDDRFTIRPLDTAGLKAWRTGRQVASATAGPRDPGSQVTRGPAPTPLSPGETHDAMYADTLTAIRSDRDSYRRAVAWLKAAAPGMGELSDAEVEAILDAKVRESVERVTRQRGLWKPVTVGG